jgi:hypothetical protein
MLEGRVSEMADRPTPQGGQLYPDEHPLPPGTGTPDTEDARARASLIRAWVSVALVPVFFLVAFAAAAGVYALTGYDPSAGATPPFWADLAAGLVSLAILLSVCAVGVVHGLRAARGGRSAGLVPAVIAALLGLGSVLLVVLNWS